MTRFAGVLEAWLDARPPVIIKATTATAASSPVIFRTTQRQKPFDNGWIGLKTLGSEEESLPSLPPSVTSSP